MSTYVFDQTWERERDRLRSLEAIYDDATIRYLTTIGVAPGWTCLEVGCGAGSVARWMAERVGSGGRVVATDLDTRFVEEQPNLEVRTHDITTGAPEDAAFDLVHARAVLEHVKERETALANVLAAVRPGGWVLLEDIDCAGPMAPALARYTYPSEHAPVIEHLLRAGEAAFAFVGASAGFGAQLVGALQAAGFEQVGGEVHGAIVSGGSEQWARGTAEQLRPHLVATGAITDDEIARFLDISTDPTVHYTPPAMASAWGRRPSS